MMTLPSAPVTPAPATPPAHPRPCLLLVDDTPSNIDVLIGVLKSQYELKVANRGAKALAICESGERIDLVLLDIMMPEMDGFEVCRRLRANPSTRDLPVIFLTAKTAVEDIVRGFEIGATDYVSKPFRPQELRARVRTLLTLRAQQREILDKNGELKELLHIICHDVGNQFAVISMALELLANHPGASPARFLPRMATAARNGIGLSNLVRELRRTEEKAIPLSPVALRPALEEALVMAEDRIRAKELTVTDRLPAADVFAEPFSLTNSVLGNVLSNAIKFSPRGGSIEIAGEVRDATVEIWIRDRGIGIPPAALAQLFDVTRSHSRPGTEGERGTGFGMPLLWRAVTQCGGTVAVTSRDAESHPDDHGTEFHLTLRRSG